MNEDLKLLTPRQLADLGILTIERTRQAVKKLTNLFKSRMTEHAVTPEQFSNLRNEYKKEFEDASAEEERIWRFVHERAGIK